MSTLEPVIRGDVPKPHILHSAIAIREWQKALPVSETESKGGQLTAIINKRTVSLAASGQLHLTIDANAICIPNLTEQRGELVGASSRFVTFPSCLCSINLVEPCKEEQREGEAREPRTGKIVGRLSVLSDVISRRKESNDGWDLVEYMTGEHISIPLYASAENSIQTSYPDLTPSVEVYKTFERSITSVFTISLECPEDTPSCAPRLTSRSLRYPPSTVIAILWGSSLGTTSGNRATRNSRSTSGSRSTSIPYSVADWTPVELETYQEETSEVSNDKAALLSLFSEESEDETIIYENEDLTPPMLDCSVAEFLFDPDELIAARQRDIGDSLIRAREYFIEESCYENLGFVESEGDSEIGTPEELDALLTIIEQDVTEIQKLIEGKEQRDD